MARIKYQQARKDYPAYGIKKGDKYYYARVKTGPYSSREIRQLTPIRRSQMTSSDFLSQFYGLQERLEDLGSKPCLAELEGELSSISDDARALGEEQQEKFDNMPDSLQGGSTGEQVEGRATAMDSWADSLEQASSSAADKASEFETNQSEWADYDNADAEYDSEDPDQEAPEEPSEERMDEDDLVQEILGEIEEPDCY